MSPTVVLLRHEARIQARSLRFRASVVVYLAVNAIAPILTFLRREEMTGTIGPATYPVETMAFLPATTLLLALLLSVDGLTRERSEGAWSTLGLAPFSNAGWVLRRFLALSLLVGVVGAVPLALGAGLALAAGGSPDPRLYLLPWVLRILPIAALGVAGGLALGAVGDGAVPSIALGILFVTLGPVVLSKTLGRWGVEHGLSERWLGWWLLEYRAGRIQEAAAGKIPRYWWEKGMPYPASEAPPDIPTAVAADLPYLLPCVALAAIALAGGSRFLRRSRPDQRPWRVGSAHPLRSFVKLAAKVRFRYAPDPRFSPADRGLTALLVAVALLLYGTLANRALEARAAGRERYAAEISGDPAPMPASLVPGRWRVSGSLQGRTLDVRVAMEMRNGGEEPVERFVYAVNPDLDVSLTESRSGAGLTRRWDRLSLELERPLAPGETRELTVRLHGRPAELRFSVNPYQSFHRAFGHHARQGGAALGLAPTRREPFVSPGWTELGAETLFPRPRYTSWGLVEPRESWQGGPFVADEAVDPPLGLSVRLEVSAGGVDLVDACGGRLVGGLLESACLTSPATYRLAGGRRERIEGPPSFFVLPAHVDRVDSLRRALSIAGARLEAAWPGAPRPEDLVVVERPFDESGPFGWQSRLLAMEESIERLVEVRDRLLILGEESFAVREPLPPDSLASAVLGSWLVRRRPGVADEAFLQRWLLEKAATRRLWPSRAASAVLPANRVGPSIYAVELSRYEYPAPPAGRRLDALLAALEARVGPATVRTAIDGFLEGRDPGRIEELFRLLADLSGDLRWVRAFHEEYVAGSAVPVLALADVRFSREGEEWIAQGRVANERDGSLVCPVTLTTEIAPVTAAVEIPSGGSGSFRLATPYRPQAVFLDPEEICFRYRPLNARERVDFEGTASDL